MNIRCLFIAVVAVHAILNGTVDAFATDYDAAKTTIASSTDTSSAELIELPSLQELHTWIDDTGHATAQQALQAYEDKKYKLERNNQPNLGRVEGAVWLHLRLSKEDLKAFVMFRQPGLEHGEAFAVFRPEPKSSNAAFVSKIGSWKLEHNPMHQYGSFQLPFWRINAHQELLVQVKGRFGIRLPTLIVREATGSAIVARHSAIVLLLLGFMLANAAINLALYVYARRDEYLFNALTVVFFHFLLQSGVLGLWFSVFPNIDLVTYSKGILICIAAGSYCFAKFGATFIQLESGSVSTTLLRFSRVGSASTILITIGLWNADLYSFLIKPLSILALVNVSFLNLEAARAKSKDRASSRIFICATALFLLGATFYTANANGWLMTGILGDYGILWGSTAMAFLISVHLGRSIQRLEQEKRMIAHEELLNRRFRTFLRILSHDLANQIFKLQLYLSQRQENLSKDPTQKMADAGYTQKLESVAETISEMICNVRDLDAVMSGKNQVRVKKISLNKICLDSILELAERIKSKKISLRMLQMNSEEIFVLGNEHLLKHSVMINLLTNAIKFSHQNSEVTVTLGCEGDFAIVEVADQGIGIPHELLEKLFQDQEQTSRPGTSGEKGTGFGLPVVSSIVESLQGCIAVSSHESKGIKPDQPVSYAHAHEPAGSRFAFCIPIFDSSNVNRSQQRQMPSYETKKAILLRFMSKKIRNVVSEERLHWSEAAQGAIFKASSKKTA